MKFYWDLNKEQKNKRDHEGFDFSYAEAVFSDPLSVTVYDRYENGEHRYQTFGMVGTNTLLLVVHTYPNDEIDDEVRVISLRRANPQERRNYEKNFDT